VPAEPTTPSSQAAASAVVAALERAWSAIRADHPDVPEVVVILGAGSQARRGLFKWGHFAAARWHVAGANHPEVLVSGEGLNRGARAVLATLLHEAAHGLAHTRGVNDTSRQGRWHNRRFAALAAELGLDVSFDKPTGWSQSRLTDRLTGRTPPSWPAWTPRWGCGATPSGSTARRPGRATCWRVRVGVAAGCGSPAPPWSRPRSSAAPARSRSPPSGR
jgi:hypothetical protein